MLELDDLIRRLESSKARVPGAKQALMHHVGQKVADKVKQFTPVDTGTLRGSIRHEISGDSVRITSDTEYAPYVDQGHVTRGGGTFVPGHHMTDKAMLQADAIIGTGVDRFVDQINLLG